MPEITSYIFAEQGRLDGALCSFAEEEKKAFLQTAFKEHGIVNMEMESACLIALCNRAKVKCKSTSGTWFF